jgi:hypothetical protein
MSTGSCSDAEDDDWEGDWDEEETQQCRSLFCAESFPTVEECIAHDASMFKFNLIDYKRQVCVCTSFPRGMLAVCEHTYVAGDAVCV